MQIVRVFRLLCAIVFGMLASRAVAFPEYQAYIQQHSGQPVNCGMCHAHPDGPSGSGAHQLGSLTPEEMERVNLSRGAQEPGQDIDNPILNAFGNHIVKAAGSKKVYELRENPAALAKTLANSDLDGDGIPDSREYLDGTDPLNRFHGNPGQLLLINLQRKWGQVLFAIIALGLVLLGLTRVLKSKRSAETE